MTTKFITIELEYILYLVFHNFYSLIIPTMYYDITLLRYIDFLKLDYMDITTNL